MKKERKKKLKYQHPPIVNCGSFQMQTFPQPTLLSGHYMDEVEKTNIITIISTADNSAGSSLYADCL